MIEDADQADVDESVAHLERALHLRRGAGADERSAGPPERAGQLFADAGSRAFAALNYITFRDLLGRAAVLLPSGPLAGAGDPAEPRGRARGLSGRAESSDALLTEALGQAHATGSERDALRASVQLLANRIYRINRMKRRSRPRPNRRDAPSTCSETLGNRGRGRGGIGLGGYLAYVRAHCDEAQRWATEAMFRALAAGRPREATQAAGDLVGMAFVGPVPFTEFARGCRGTVHRSRPHLG